MLPTDFKVRKECHEYLAELIKLENRPEEQRKKIVIDIFHGEFEDYDHFKNILDWAFDEVDGRYMAVVQYFCAKHRIMCSQIPAYMDFMPKLYNNPDELISDVNSNFNASEVKTETESAAEYRIIKEQLAEKDKQIQTLLALLGK